ncbi:hypothetical protein ACT4W7_10470 [Acinetobacter baumannii]
MLIELYDQLRKNLIEINDFYLEQCQLKLLNQFDNISQEADEYEEKWRTEKESHYFNKDPYDSSSLYYDSYDASIIFYQNLRALLHKHSKAEFSPIHSNLRHNLGARST